MSLQVSNLYAARIFAEHPSAFWPLDEDVDFLSLLNESQREIVDSWSMFNLTMSENSIVPIGQPIENSKVSTISIESASASYSGYALANPINSFTDLDQDKKTISINGFVYDFLGFVESYDIGFIINDNIFDTNIPSLEFAKWQNISHTIQIPETNVDIYPYIKINYKTNSLNDSGEDYEVAFNGMTVGQWSEQFNYKKLGVFSEEIENQELLNILQEQSILNISETRFIKADSYGISDQKNGYYLVEKNRMLASNTSLPITFGANNITNIKKPIFGIGPSLVFPGEGFLNERGRYYDYTAEFWLRVYSNSINPIKIFGPLTSGDGLYIERDFVTIKIGSQRQSYFIGKWYRPMLIDFRYEVENASLLINGEVVIRMDIDQSRLELPLENKDYLGFYGSDNAYPFDIDAFAIYPYSVQEQVAKRRFIYAQAVDSADNVFSNLKGDSYAVDFPFAKYTSTLNYPDMSDWNSGFFSNANSTSQYLTFPGYVPPEIIFDSNIEIDDFLQDNFQIQGSDYPFIKLKPNENYQDIKSRIYFQTLNVLNSPVKSLFGLFRTPDILTEQKETLMFFSNNFNNDIFEVKVSSSGLEYFYNSILLESLELEPNSIFVAGFDLDLISAKFRTILGNFFYNPQNISFSLGGSQESMFSGKIYEIGMNNRFFTDKDLKQYFNENGFFISDLDPNIFLSYIGNYTFYPQVLSDSLILDVGTSGYWEDSIPLSYFGKIIQTRRKKKIYDLDLLQFNIEIPSPIIVKKDQYYVLDGGFSTSSDYEIAFDCGGVEESNTTLSFDGGEPETTQFVEFLTDAELAIAYGSFSQPNHTIKVFMTIQDYKNVGKVSYLNYVNSERIGADRVLDFDSVTSVNNTKYEITDKTIIFPPKELVDFNDYYVTIHIEFQTRGIKKNPLRIKRMSLSSLAYDESSFYSIGSPNGYQMFPFTKIANTYVYKQNNPFFIDKNSSSYMYKTADSGFSVLPYENKNYKRGLTIPINQQVSEEYLLNGIQLWCFYNKDFTIKDPQPLAQLNTKERSYDIVLIPEQNSARGEIVVYEKSDNKSEKDLIVAKDLVFYQNGIEVNKIFIEPVSWNTIVITFKNPVKLNNTVGQFEIYEGWLVNNVAFYKQQSDILGNVVVDQSWSELKGSGNWSNILDLDYEWDDIDTRIDVETNIVDGPSIYNATFGISSVVSRDEATLSIDSEGFNLITGTVWNQFALKPV
jgi:hypothetical protein